LALFFKFYYLEPCNDDGDRNTDADDGYRDDIRNPQNVEFDKKSLPKSLFFHQMVQFEMFENNFGIPADFPGHILKVHGVERFKLLLRGGERGLL
jgi:hypothetical protein